MIEYIFDVALCTFIFSMACLRIRKNWAYGNKDEVTPILRFVIFTALYIMILYLGRFYLINVDKDKLYICLEIFPLFAGTVFYIIDYETYKDDETSIDIINQGISNAFKNHIAFILLSVIAFYGDKMHSIKSVIIYVKYVYAVKDIRIFYILLEIIIIISASITIFKTSNTVKTKYQKRTFSAAFFIIIIIYFLNNVTYLCDEQLFSFLKASVFIGSFLFYTTDYVEHYKNKGNIEFAHRTIKMAFINHIITIILISLILFYEYNFLFVH